MKPLPTEFRKNGFDFRLLRREGDVALFEKSKPSHSQPSWEVVFVAKNPPREYAGVKMAASESLPSSERWGIEGWTFTDLDSARKKFVNLSPE